MKQMQIQTNTAEEIFQNNIGSKILVKLINDDKDIMQGKLEKIFCNTFIISNELDRIEMFRYEDVEYLKLIE